MTTYKNLLLEVEENIVFLTINRPNSLNALNSELLAELDKAIDEVAQNEAVSVVIITGAGEKTFVAGADINEMAAKKALEAQEFSQLANATFKKIATLRQPTIAAINGYALGGGLELALATDIRIGADSVILGQPEVGLGIIPGFGGTQRLSRLVGLAKAKEIILTAQDIEAKEALHIGLLNQVVASDQLMKAAKEMSRHILANAPLAVQHAKQVINEGYKMLLDQAITLEENTFGLLFSTADQKEGMQAFIDRRAAEFKSH